ncbi:PAS domain-containing sensor histidine kinase, partial [Methanobrevibacter sp. UBA313]
VSLMHEFLVPEDKNKLVEVFDLSTSKPTSEVTYRIISQDNTLKYIYSQNKAIFNKYGQVIRKIGFIMDVTEETLAKNEAFELQDNINQIQSLSKIFITTYKDGNFTYTDEAYNLCETTKEETASNDLINVVVPEDLKKIFKLVNSVSYENPNFQIKYRILTAKGNNRIFSCKATGKFDDKHELIKIVGFIQDVTETVEYEETLKQLSEDRKVLLQEVHHRVKNNLQLILSFLNLESRFNKNNPEYVLNQAYNRIHTMALTHEEVYNSDSLSNVNLKTFLEDAINNLFNLYSKGNIKLHLDIEPIEIDMDRSIPLGLLVNEVSLNTIKYAFPNEVEGNYYITIKNIDGILDLKIWDDGVGLANGVDLFTAESLGFIIIRNFTQQLDANLTQLSNVKGFGLELKFKI